MQGVTTAVMLRAHELVEPDSATICETPDLSEKKNSPKFHVTAHKLKDNLKRQDESNIVHSTGTDEHRQAH